jgi:hypothetical protein
MALTSQVRWSTASRKHRSLVRALDTYEAPHNQVNLAVDAQARFANAGFSPALTLTVIPRSLGITGCASRDTGAPDHPSTHGT